MTDWLAAEPTFFDALAQFGEQPAIQMCLTESLKALLHLPTTESIAETTTALNAQLSLHSDSHSEPYHHHKANIGQISATLFGDVPIVASVTVPSDTITLLTFTYEAIASAADACASQISANGERKLGFILARNDLPTFIAYLACLRHRQPVMLLDANLSEQTLDSLKSTYQPDFIVKENQIELFSEPVKAIDASLSLLLSTSGSTGSPKQVALSAVNLQANAASICQYLPIESSDIALTTLPFFYSYGLSIINSHLLSGACVLLSDTSVVDRQFWQLLEASNVTSFGGVPYSYDMLIRLGLTKKALPSLRYFTQAGGKLAAKKVTMLADYAEAHGKSFYVMYGQTEATARMAYADLAVIKHKPDSIGQAIPRGQFTLDVNINNEQHHLSCSRAVEASDTEAKASAPEHIGELIYTGANVMLGYAHQLADLQCLPKPHCLHTGDLAYADEDGHYFIVGRLSRFIKVFGLRVALDEVQALLNANQLDTYVLGKDNQIQVLVTESSLSNNASLTHGEATVTTASQLIKWLSLQLQVHHSVIKVSTIAKLPITVNGKADYATAQQCF